MKLTTFLTLALLPASPTFARPITPTVVAIVPIQANQQPYHVTEGGLEEKLRSAVTSLARTMPIESTYQRAGLSLPDAQPRNYASSPYLMPNQATPWSNPGYTGHHRAQEPWYSGSCATYAPFFGFGVMCALGPSKGSQRIITW